METLFLRFFTNSGNRVIDEDTSVRWVLETDPAEPNDCGTVKLSNASELIQDRKIVILLPVEQFYLQSVAVQTKNKKQLEKAIPYALEDDLTQDIEDLHFALGKRAENREIPVAVISKAHVDHLLEILSSVNILPDIITADIYGIEYKENQWTLCIEEGHLIARTNDWNGFSCDLVDFNDFMNIAFIEQDEPPSKITVYSHPDEEVTALAKIENVELEDIWSPSVYVNGFSSESCINLLQGSYAKADKTHKTTRPWKIAAVLGSIWVAISMIHTSIEYNRYNKLNTSLTKEVDQVFRSTFPEVKNVVNARVQMEQRFKKLSSTDANTSHADFLKFLHQSGYELYKNPNISITDIQYKNKQLSLEIKAKDIQVLETVKTKLQSKDINAELQTAKTVDDFVLARMLVSE